MRARTLERAAEAITRKAATEAVAMRIDEHVWLWVDGPDLFLRTKPGEVREVELVVGGPGPGDVRFIREACGARAEGPGLAVERGDEVSIGGVPIPTPHATLLEGIEDGYGPLTWRRWQSASLAARGWERSWLVARGRDGSVVAVWKVPEGRR